MDSPSTSLHILDEEDDKLREYLERHSSSSANSSLFQDSDEPAKPNQCTNPFLSPTVFNTVTDTQSFFEKLLRQEQNLSSPTEEVTCRGTNPFLDGYIERSNTFSLPLQSPTSSSKNSSVSLLKDSNSFEEFIKDSTMTSDMNECAIKNYFDFHKWKIGEFIPLRISNIYHPSRFWIVPKYRELEIFMEYLCSYYSKNRDNYRVNQVSQNLYCVVSTNNLYYRAIVVSFLPNDPHRVKVFLFDYGTILLVFTDEVYYLQEKFYNVPQFAVRASLAYVCPKNHQMWTSDVVKMFDNFTTNKVLIGQVINIDTNQKCLEINVGEIPSDGYSIIYVNEWLIQEGVAKYIFDKREQESSEYVSKVKHLYLFPSFDLIETGKVASSVYHFEALKGSVAFDVLYNQYCSLTVPNM